MPYEEFIEYMKDYDQRVAYKVIALEHMEDDEDSSDQFKATVINARVGKRKSRQRAIWKNDTTYATSKIH